jgi:hypothetical protein
MIPYIKLYGTETCKKLYYKKYLEDLNLEYSYLDVELNTVSEELRVFETRNNFPTLHWKKLRNQIGFKQLD